MGNSDKESAGGETFGAYREEAERLLEEIKQLKAKADEQLKATELARKNADSEGLFAINAKRTCEEHATAVSALKGAVETDVNSIVSNKQKADELMAAVNATKATIAADAKTINDRRKDVDQSAQEIIKAAETGAAHLQEVQKCKESAIATQEVVNETATAAVASKLTAESAQKESEKSSSTAASLAIKATQDQKTISQRAEDIEKLLAAARTNQESLAEVLEHLRKSHEIATGFESRVSKSAQDLEALIKTTEGMLPGITSATLASAFSKQKERFSSPRDRWMLLFGFCMFGLLAVGFPSFYQAIKTGAKVEDWNELLRSLLVRLPVMVPFVWLGIYAGRNYMLSIRLEEEYAYKEAVASAFEGYKRQMEKIEPGDPANPNPLNTLCRTVLTAMAERPGRIYEGAHIDITPLNEARGAAAVAVKKIAES